MHVEDLIAKYKLVSDQIEPDELRVLLNELVDALVKTEKGAVVEFGCYVGTASLFIQRLLQNHNREFHVYDSFSGLPDKTEKDESPAGTQFKTGELLASKAEFIRNFKKANLPLPTMHKGWFSDLSPNDVPSEIAFAFLDGDYYESVMTPLRLIESRLMPGAIIVVDDYQNEALPGAEKAVNEWLDHHPVFNCKVQASLAILST